ncbi:MAG: Spy/CpxP family protein refolding chaperone [bacterium]
MKVNTSILAHLGAFVFAFAPFLGCQPADEQKSDTVSKPMKTPEGVKAELPEHHGPGKLIVKALAELELRADQRAKVDGLVTQTKAQLATTRSARAALMRAAARQIRAGKVNQEQLAALAEKLKADFVKARPQLVAALNSLHATLDAEQRRQLVDKLKAMHHGRMKKHFGDDAVSPHGIHGKRGFHGHHGFGGGHRRLKRIASKLGLTQGQQDRIADVIQNGIRAMHPDGDKSEAGFHGFHGRIQAAVKAFLSDDFDAAKLPFLSDAHQPAFHGKLQKILTMGQAILPILSADQRAKIATHLEYRADLLSD